MYKQNTLTNNIRDIQEKDRYDIIVANPPFGGKEKPQIQQNFPIQANATELLFLQHFMKSLKKGGKAAIVIPEGVLFQTGNAFRSVKEELLANFNVHTILSLPAGVFLPYSGVKTNVIFFDRTGATSDIWYYECNPEQKLTKNKPIQYEHLKEFVELYPKRALSQNSWLVRVADIVDTDLSAKNPNISNDLEHMPPKEILSHIEKTDIEANRIIFEVKNNVNDGSILENIFKILLTQSKIYKIKEIADIKGGKRLPKGEFVLDEKTEYPYIRVTDFTDDGTINLNSLKYIKKEVYEQIKRYIITSSDLYISIAGTIGKTGIIPKQLDNANLTENAARLVFKPSIKINNRFIYYFTLSDNFKEQVGLATKTVAQPKLALTRLAEVEIPIPSLDLQDKLVKELDLINSKIDEIIENQQFKLKYLKALKASLLDRVFNGEL